ncbi:MAG: helix-turn-helix domain-containing protein, partial [Planctomycetota bacterium]
YGTPTAEGVELSIRLSHQDLAAIIGATRETVTTLLGEMQDNGILVIRRQRLIIHDVRALAESVRPADWVEPPREEPKFSETFTK